MRIGKFRVIALSKSENIADDYGGGEEKERNAMVFGRKLFQFGCNGAQAEVFLVFQKTEKGNLPFFFIFLSNFET